MNYELRHNRCFFKTPHRSIYFLVSSFLFLLPLKAQIVIQENEKINALPKLLSPDKTHEVLENEAAASDSGFEESAREHMLEELGVNNITTPLVGKVFHDLELFQPPPVQMLSTFNNNDIFSNRLQTALQFGALVADGFVATIARQQKLINDTGRALIKNAHALAAGQQLTYHSKSFFELSDRGDWQGLREELNRCQDDVERSMVELHDGEMADLISLGGWLRGFQLALHVTNDHYTSEKAAELIRLPVMDYFIERMDTLSPRLKKRPIVITLAAKLKTMKAIIVQSPKLTESEVAELQVLADEALKSALTHADKKE